MGYNKVMAAEHRPDPDALLAALKKEEAKQCCGRLKIFLGMAAGVGKTYAMLEAAHAQQAAGTDVVIGYIETHRRLETDALVEGLPLVPRRSVEYRGTQLTELDLDAVLARRPQLVLVDELAHTNAPARGTPNGIKMCWNCSMPAWTFTPRSMCNTWRVAPTQSGRSLA